MSYVIPSDTNYKVELQFNGSQGNPPPAPITTGQAGGMQGVAPTGPHQNVFIIEGNDGQLKINRN
jgi:hypothetical protein